MPFAEIDVRSPCLPSTGKQDDQDDVPETKLVHRGEPAIVIGEYVLGTPAWIAGSNARFSACENAENTK